MEIQIHTTHDSATRKWYEYGKQIFENYSIKQVTISYLFTNFAHDNLEMNMDYDGGD